jgi:excisionase family DNA binding protein
LPFKVAESEERKTVQPPFMTTVVDLLTKALSRVSSQQLESSPIDQKQVARLRASQNANFMGQKPPEDKGLLIDSRQAAKLLGISERTLWEMWNTGQMPRPIRIGRVVRFAYEELRAWVNAGGPPQENWMWPKRDK